MSRGGAAAERRAICAPELGLWDDIASDVLIDSALGFTTHKMAGGAHRRRDVDMARLEVAMLRLAHDGNLYRAFRSVFCGGAGEGEGDVIMTRDFPGSEVCDSPLFQEHAYRWVKTACLGHMCIAKCMFGPQVQRVMHVWATRIACDAWLSNSL